MEIDWEDQWTRFAPGFREGFLPISLKPFKGLKRVEEVRLRPGPGFGDYSHPTTQLTLELLAPLVKGKPLLDIGCGSGILSVVCFALGASEVLGIDIDPEAIQHAKENTLFNHFDLFFSLPDPILPPFLEGVIALNMISSEQEVAWKSLPRLKDFTGDLVVSGLLEKEEQVAVERFKKRGWTFKKKKVKQGWLAFHFGK
jgi:ribosomal protein L11 methyltransferase